MEKLDEKQLETLVDRVADEAAKRVLRIFEKGMQALVLERVIDAREARGDDVALFTMNYEVLLKLGYTPEQIGETAEKVENAIKKALEDMPPLNET